MMRWATVVVVALVGVGGPLGSSAQEPKVGRGADMVLSNGAIFTAGDETPWVEAVAIKGGLIVGLGSSEDMRRWVGRDTRLIDLRQRMVIPGLVDLSVDPIRGEAPRLNCLIPDESTEDELLRQVELCARALRKGELVLGGNWAPETFANGPRGSLLDEVAGDRPVVLWSYTEREALANESALRLAGLWERSTPRIEGVVRDATGRPTGIVRSEALALLTSRLPTGSVESRTKTLSTYLPFLEQAGVTTFASGPLDRNDLEAFHRLEEGEQLHVRVIGELNVTFDDWTSTATTPASAFPRSAVSATTAATLAETYRSKLIEPGFVRVLVDGQLDERRAWLEEGFGGRLRGYRTRAELRAILDRLEAVGLSAVLDVKGGGAVTAALEVLEGRSARHRLGGVSLVSNDTLDRIFSSGTPVELASTAKLLEERRQLRAILGSDRVERLTPARDLLDGGALVTSGTQFPRSKPYAPWTNVEALVRRRISDGPESTPLGADQAVEVAEALRMVTVNAAAAVGLDDQVGTIALGRRADLVVLNQHLMRIDASLISETESLLTIFDGRAVYDRISGPDTTVERDVHPQDSPAFKGFVIAVRELNARLRIRASIRLDAAVSLEGLEGNDGFAPILIPTGTARSVDTALSVSPAQSRFGFEAETETLVMRLEADFWPEGQLRLRHAYGAVRESWLKGQLTVGQTWTTFVDVTVLPWTVVFEGPGGGPEQFRQPLLRFTHQIDEGLTLESAIEAPTAEVEQIEDIESAAQFFPDLIMALKLRRPRSTLGSAFLFRAISVAEPSGQRILPAFGGNFFGAFDLNEVDVFRFAVVAGTGVSRYVAGLQGQNLDAVYDASKEAYVLLNALSLYAAYEHRWNQRIASNVIFAYTDTFTRQSRPESAFRHGETLYFNTFWDILQGLRVGLEYNFGFRRDFDGASGNASRLSAIVYFDF